MYGSRIFNYIQTVKDLIKDDLSDENIENALRVQFQESKAIQEFLDETRKFNLVIQNKLLELQKEYTQKERAITERTKISPKEYNDPRKWLTVKQFHAKIRDKNGSPTEATIRNWIRKGEIEHVKISERITKISVSEVKKRLTGKTT